MFGHLPSYERIDIPHRQVHQQVYEMLALSQEDWQSDPVVRERILQGFNKVEAASAHLIITISELVEEKRRLESLATSRKVSSDIELF